MHSLRVALTRGTLSTGVGSAGIYLNIFVHVMVGTIFITVGFVRLVLYHLTSDHHIGFEAAILYWHFVDIVWLFLFVAVYWWGGA